MTSMRFGYADPPYLGCGKRYVENHPDALIWDDPDTHGALIDRLVSDYPDGWAYSLSSPTLRTILPFCPPAVRVMAWVKPFCSFKPNVNPAYAWEPVIVMGGRKRDREQPTVADFVSCNIALRRGLVGAKPLGFCLWLFSIFGAVPGDTLDDLFPGTGAISNAWDCYTRQTKLFELVAE